MFDLVSKLIVGVLGVIGFFVVVIIPWLIGIGQILDMIKSKEQWYK